MMRFNLSELAVRERAITLFLIVAIILSGLYAFLHLGRAEDPAFTIKNLTVTAVWPGATAEEMQNLVADPLEKRMQELRWYDHVETFTRPGIAVMMVELSDKTPPAAVPDHAGPREHPHGRSGGTQLGPRSPRSRRTDRSDPDQP